MLTEFPELADDDEVVEQAVMKDGLSLRLASERMRNSHNVVRAAVQQNGLALEFASAKFKSSHWIVIRAVQNDGMALQFASKQLRTNRKDIVRAAVQQNGRALEFASEDQLNDPDLVLAAVRQDAWAFSRASPYLLANRSWVLSAMRANGLALKHLVPRGNVPSTDAAAGNLQSAASAYWRDRDIALAAVRQNVMAYQFTSWKQRIGGELQRLVELQDGVTLLRRSATSRQRPMPISRRRSRRCFNVSSLIGETRLCGLSRPTVYSLTTT